MQASSKTIDDPVNRQQIIGLLQRKRSRHRAGLKDAGCLCQQHIVTGYDINHRWRKASCNEYVIQQRQRE